MISPASFFEKMPRTGGYWEPLKFALISIIIGMLVSFVLIMLLFLTPIISGSVEFSAMTNIIYNHYLKDIVLTALGYGMGFAIAGAIGLFIAAVVYLILFKLVGGKGNYEGTFRVLAYSYATLALLIIPFLFLYTLYLLIVGGKFVHGVSGSRAAAAVFFPFIIAGAFVLFIIYWFIIPMTDFKEASNIDLQVSSATPASIELANRDYLTLSDMQFTVTKVDGEELYPMAISKSGSNTVSAGDTIILYGANFGRSGDVIKISGRYRNYKIYSAQTQIK